MTRRTGQLFILSINWIFAGKLGQRKRTAWKYWMLPPIVKPYCYRLERQLSPRRRVPPRARNLPISTPRHVAGSTSSDCQVINIFGKYFCSPLSKKYFVRLYCWLLGGGTAVNNDNLNPVEILWSDPNYRYHQTCKQCLAMESGRHINKQDCLRLNLGCLALVHRDLHRKQFYIGGCFWEMRTSVLTLVDMT